MTRPPQPGAGVDAHALHDAVRLDAFPSRRFTHAELWAVLLPLIDGAPNLSRAGIGASAEGRPLRAIRFGDGPTRVLLWSQMHGDEPTHTMGLADLFAYLAVAPDDPCVRRLGERLSVVAVPMLNPDGAERFQRLNAQAIDINRDASAWFTPELRALRDIAAEFGPDFALNLHDQDPRKRVGRSDRLAAFALLANPFNDRLDNNPARLRAKRLCVAIKRAVDPLVGGHVCRFPDEYNPQGSGEFMATSGASALLLECGWWRDDPEKQFLRKVSFVALLAALDAIAEDSHADAPLSEYQALEEADSSVYDVLVRGGTIVTPGMDPYRADVGIEYPVPLDKADGYVAAVGDFSDFAAEVVVDASGLFLHPGATDRRGSGDPAALEIGAPADLALRVSREPSSELRWSIEAGVVRPANPNGAR